MANKKLLKRAADAPTCSIHPETELVCLKCVAAKGGSTTAAIHGNEQMREWGKLGGRPKKNI